MSLRPGILSRRPWVRRMRGATARTPNSTPRTSSREFLDHELAGNLPSLTRPPPVPLLDEERDSAGAARADELGQAGQTERAMHGPRLAADDVPGDPRNRGDRPEDRLVADPSGSAAGELEQRLGAP